MSDRRVVVLLRGVAEEQVSRSDKRYYEWCAEFFDSSIEDLMPPDDCFSCKEWDNPNNTYGQICACCAEGDKRIPDDE